MDVSSPMFKIEQNGRSLKCSFSVGVAVATFRHPNRENLWNRFTISWKLLVPINWPTRIDIETVDANFLFIFPLQYYHYYRLFYFSVPFRSFRTHLHFLMSFDVVVIDVVFNFRFVKFDFIIMFVSFFVSKKKP